MTELVVLLTELSGVGGPLLWSGLVVFLRVGAVIAVMPVFGEQQIPQRVRLAVALAFTAIVTPGVSDRIPPYDGVTLMPILTEAVIGLTIGIGLRIFILALQTAGAIAAQATSLSQLFAGAAPEPQPAIANLLVFAGLALAATTGLHVRASEFLILSYDLFSPGRLPEAKDIADWGLFQVIRAFSLAFTLAAPFVIASVIYNVALGVINRAMPQLMVTLVGAPALTAGSLVIMAIALPLALMVWVHALHRFLDAPFAVMP